MKKVHMLSIFCSWKFLLASETRKAIPFQWVHSLLMHLLSWQNPQGCLHSAVLLAMCQWLLPVPPEVSTNMESQVPKKRERGKGFSLSSMQRFASLNDREGSFHTGVEYAVVIYLHKWILVNYISTFPEFPEITWNHITWWGVGMGHPIKLEHSQIVSLVCTTRHPGLGLLN